MIYFTDALMRSLHTANVGSQLPFDTRKEVVNLVKYAQADGPELVRCLYLLNKRDELSTEYRTMYFVGPDAKFLFLNWK